MGQEFAADTGLAIYDRVVSSSPLVVFIRLPTSVMKDDNRACVNRSMIAHVGRGFDDRLGSGHSYRLEPMGRATAGGTAEMSTASEVKLGEGETGWRSLEFKLLSGKTIILLVDNQTRVHDVLHKLRLVLALVTITSFLHPPPPDP